MKKILISAVMILALAGGSAFAAQNSNTGKPTAKHTMKKKTKKHRRTASKTMNKNS